MLKIGRFNVEFSNRIQEVGAYVEARSLVGLSRFDFLIDKRLFNWAAK